MRRNTGNKFIKNTLNWKASSDGTCLLWSSYAPNTKVFSYEMALGKSTYGAKGIAYTIKIEGIKGKLYASDYLIAQKEITGGTIDSALTNLKKIAEVHRKNRENTQLRFEKIKKTLGVNNAGEKVTKEIYESSGFNKYYEIYKDNEGKWMARVGDKKDRFLDKDPENLLNQHGENEFEYLVNTCNSNNLYYKNKHAENSQKFQSKKTFNKKTNHYRKESY